MDDLQILNNSCILVKAKPSRKNKPLPHLLDLACLPVRRALGIQNV